MNEFTARDKTDISTWRILRGGETVTPDCYVRSLQDGQFDPVEGRIIGLILPTCFQGVIVKPNWTIEQILEREA